jgi:hypothetical protein
MIKKILISMGVVIAVSAITVGVLLSVKSTQSSPSTTMPTSNTLVLDHSKDYGACTLLDTSSIKTALGDTAAHLQAPVDVGIIKDTYFGDGVKNIVSDSQTCIYAFAPGGNSDNTLSGTDAFMVKMTVYTNKDGPNTLITQTKQNPNATAIASLGDAAFYLANTTSVGPEATSSFELLVFRGSKSTSYSIIKPTKGSTLTIDSAKAALMILAK